MEDKNKVIPCEHSFDCSKETGLFWRLPFPDEDHLDIGEYEDYDRGILLIGCPADVVNFPGSIRMEDKSGLIVDVACYHGVKLPAGGDIISSEWKQSTFADFETVEKPKTKSCFMLKSVFNTEEKVRFCIECTDCGKSLVCDFEEIEEFIDNEELKNRLRAYTQS